MQPVEPIGCVFLYSDMKKFFLLASTDYLLMVVVGFASHWIIKLTAHDANLFIVLLLPAFIIAALAIAQFYRIRIANSSIELVKRAVLAFLPVVLLATLIIAYVYGFQSYQLRWTVVFCALSFLVIIGSRAIWRMISESTNRKAYEKPVALVCGAGDLGSTMARLAMRGRFDYEIAGFVDDDEGLQHELVMGYPVLGKLKDIDSILRTNRKKIEVLVIAITKLSSEKMQEAVMAAKKNEVQVKIVPNLFEAKGRADVNIRDIDIEDLLGRNLDRVDKEPLLKMFKGKTILVTGAGGSIGSEICSQLMGYELEKLILLDIDETELHDLALRLLNFEHEWSDKVVPVVCDIRNKDKVQRIISQYKPDIVFHAAAYKHVPLMELYPEEAIINNICGSYNVFTACKDNAVKKVIVISTDKAVNPTNVMGATKRVVEMLAASLNSEQTEFCCVRFGNVIGSRGSMLPLFLEEIKAGKPITVTDKNIIRYFMAIPEAVSLVFRAASLAKGGEVMVLDMGKPVNIYEFAKKLVNIFGDGKTQIKITGLRPGEKMYEELLANKDNTIPTENAQIFKAKVSNSDLGTKTVEQFIANLQNKTEEELVEILVKTVPEFKRNSKK